MIAAVHFKNFKALRSTALKLAPFNLVLGPNGSGKTSLIQALLRLRTLAGLPAVQASEVKGQKPTGPRIEFHFSPPYQNIRVTLGCNSDELVCNLLVVDHPSGPEAAAKWIELRTRLQSIRAYLFDHYAMAVPARKTDNAELTSNGGNLAAVLSGWKDNHPAVLAGLEAEFVRLMPEFTGLEFRTSDSGTVELGARLGENGHDFIAADSLSQGSLYLLDQFKEHPEEVVLASKHGRAATFERLSDRADLLELMKEAHLGDLWYSGILGGVPGE
jgi:energy-coupling factor transporter ATP-binding protein EcfA2